MITVKQVEKADEKTRVTLEVMNALPEWFSPPDDINNKSVIHWEYPFFVAYDGDTVIGFATDDFSGEYQKDI